MFSYCFTEKQTSTLICTESTIKKITADENKFSYLTIINENEIKKTLNENSDQVCICTVKKEGKDMDPKIISVYKFKDMTLDVKIDGKQIVNVNFAVANLVKYVQIGREVDNQALEKIKESIKPTGETYLSAYVEVKKEDNNNVVRYLIYCTDANIKNKNGLFQCSAATEIEILSCGNNITNMNSMFCQCSSLTNLDLSKLKTDQVTNMGFMFFNCNKLINIKFHDKFITSNVTDMRSMFNNCTSLININLSSFNTDKVTSMFGMFFKCSSLKELDLSNFNTDNVIDMRSMFYGCSSLIKLDLSKFNTDKVKNMSYMFANCFKNNATLICTASTIKKIANSGGSYLTITNDNEKKAKINNTLNENSDQVYIWTVERKVKDSPEVADIRLQE